MCEINACGARICMRTRNLARRIAGVAALLYEVNVFKQSDIFALSEGRFHQCVSGELSITTRCLQNAKRQVLFIVFGVNYD